MRSPRRIPSETAEANRIDKSLRAQIAFCPLSVSSRARRRRPHSIVELFAPDRPCRRTAVCVRVRAAEDPRGYLYSSAAPIAGYETAEAKEYAWLVWIRRAA